MKTSCPKSEFPRPERERSDWLCLNGIWDFMLFPEGEKGEASFDAEHSDYTRQINVPFSWGCPLSEVALDVAGVGWYRRIVQFDRPGYIFLCFGAVDYNADVFINGQHAGSHRGGYSSFELDVTPLWHSGENCITVRAEDRREKSQTSGKQRYGEIQGIWQSVWIEARPEAYLKEGIADRLYACHRK